MNDYSSLKKKTNHRTLPAAVSLLLCVVLSTSMLFSRLVSWLPADRQHYIPLTVGNGITSVVTGQRNADGTLAPDPDTAVRRRGPSPPSSATASRRPSASRTACSPT